MLYEKSYKQRESGGFKLDRYAYKIAQTRVSAYINYLDTIDEIEGKTKITETDILNKTQMEQYIAAVDKGLEWIPKHVQEPIWERVLVGTPWDRLASKYHYSESRLRHYYQMFIYGVASELGEIFVTK